MKSIEELPADRRCSPRTCREVQEHTAHRTIAAALDAITTGTADDFDREMAFAYAEYHAELHGTRESRRKRQDPMRHALAESEADSKARLEREAAEWMQRHPEKASELQTATDEFLNRFTPTTGTA